MFDISFSPQWNSVLRWGGPGRAGIPARLWSFIALCGTSLSATAAITYVDANSSNTTLNGAALVAGSNHTSGSSAGAMDNLWHLRSGVGNNGVWTADELTSGVEDVLPLVTTITFAEAGGYQLFAYIWDSEDVGEDWDARFRIGGTGVYSRFQASEAEPAVFNRFDADVLVSESPRRLIQIPLGVVVVAAGGSAQVSVDDDGTIGSRATWYDGVGYEKVFSSVGERIIAIDCNKTNALAAPSQGMFRSISGSSTTSQNSTNIIKAVGDYTLRLSKTSTSPFDFRGANGDTTRLIPGGATSKSFLVADFLGTRDGTINIAVSNLAAGTYLFRSYHLDTFNSVNLGYAQGNSSTNRNTLRAHVGGSLQAMTQPTALGTPGLATNFISDSDIPTLSFAFAADGTNVATINLSTLYTNGVDRFILLNGFELYTTAP